MKKPLFFLAFSCCIIAFLTAALGGAPASKHLVIIADWGTRPPPAAVVDMLAKTPSLKLAVPWPASSVPSAKTKELVRRGQLEPLMTLVDEPLLALINEADARDIVARGREWFQEYFPEVSPRILLRSGEYQESLVPSLNQWGVSGMILSNFPSAGQGGFAGFAGGNTVLIVGTGSVTTTDQCWQQIESSSSSVVVVSVSGPAALTPAFFSALSEKLLLDPTVVSAVPGDPLMRTWLGASVPPPLSADSSPGGVPPAIWHRLTEARTAIEEYKNSGQAVVKNMELARGELYHLYSYTVLRQLQDGTDPSAEQTFNAGLHNIYRLVGKPFPEEGSLPQASGQDDSSATSFSIEKNKNSLTIHNTPPGTPMLTINALTVRLSSAVVTYQVDISTSAWMSSSVVDIYIDMNNQRGAGLSGLLPGPAAFLFEEDGWELAVRMERYQISLYRIGRMEPVLVKTFRVAKPYQIDIPRSMLRGNPLSWGYQAVVMTRSPSGEPWRILDFLSSSTIQKARMLAQNPQQLHVIRNRNQ